MIINNFRLSVEEVKKLFERLCGKILLNSFSNGRGFDNTSGDNFIILKEINEKIKELEKELEN